jgi:aspartyl-tRNA(Asn)/glutamyl-tRNA(Gln) amidotransferase subunit C
MSVLTREEVGRIAQLARLSLSSDEIDLFSRQLTSILEYAEQLRAVDTQDVPATSHPLALAAPLREDAVRPSLVPTDAIREAPDADPAAGLFKVPRVLGA